MSRKTIVVFIVAAFVSALSLVGLPCRAVALPLCPGDLNSDGKVTIDELITAVGSALNGCPDLCRNVTCRASDQCHVAGTCDADTGTCSNPAVTDGTTCDDGNATTYLDTCSHGVCAGTRCPCEGDVFPGPTGDPTWGTQFHVAQCLLASVGPALVGFETPCFGIDATYTPQLISVEVDHACREQTFYASGTDNCAFGPIEKMGLTSNEEMACRQSLKAIAAHSGVACPF